MFFFVITLPFSSKELFSSFVEFYDFSVEVERNNAVLRGTVQNAVQKPRKVRYFSATP